ncbi:MAG: energy-coupling factor ABC transporter ATP-binding protein [Candidatus Neomarinimicrobiota bacterium]|nr:energy-coupling factor ABC transporter ATP-binding protein [Candidatus Neomarinimicrobiota bacterium]
MFNLICQNLEFNYPQNPDFRLTIPELTCSLDVPLGIYGLIGSGKSTFGKILGGLLTPASGSWRFETSGSTAKLAPRVLYLPQFPEQIFLGMSIGNALKKMLKEHSAETNPVTLFADNLKLFGLDYDRISGRYGYELSAGELRLATIALGLTIAPELTIFDEPTIALSRSARERFSDIIGAFSAKKALIIITHDYHLIRKLCPSVIIFEQGKILFKGKWQELDQNSAVIQAIGLALLDKINQRNGGNE